jgi:hypothetical protein
LMVEAALAAVVLVLVVLWVYGRVLIWFLLAPLRAILGLFWRGAVKTSKTTYGLAKATTKKVKRYGNKARQFIYTTPKEQQRLKMVKKIHTTTKKNCSQPKRKNH